MTSTETRTASWSEIRDDLAEAEAADLRAVADEATAAEKTVGQLEEQVRNGEDVKPGEIEAAEAAARHARLRLDAVQRKHAGLLEEARLAHRQQVHDALAAIAKDDDDTADRAVKDIAAAVAKLVAAVPPWNEELARLRAEVAAVDGPDDPNDLMLNNGSIFRGQRARITVDGVQLAPLSVTELIYDAVHDGVGGDWQLLGVRGEEPLGVQVRAVAHARWAEGVERAERAERLEQARAARAAR